MCRLYVTYSNHWLCYIFFAEHQEELMEYQSVYMVAGYRICPGSSFSR